MITQDKNASTHHTSVSFENRPAFDTRKTRATLARKPTTQAPLASEQYVTRAMPPMLGTLDMTTTYLMIIFFITNATTAVAGGAAAFTYWIIGGVTFFIPCVIATAQLGTMFPHEGSLYNWTHKAFGGYWSFFAAFCAWFPGVLVIVSAGDVIVAYLQGLNSHWLAEPWQQGVVLILLIIFSGILATQRFRMVQNIVNVVIGLTFLAVILLGFAGVVWLLKGNHPAASFSHFSDWNINWNKNTGNLYLFGTITLAYLGTEAPLNMGGEIIKRKVITRHLFWGTLLVLLGYFVATFALLVVQGPANGATPFALISTVDMALGKFMGNIAAICIMSFFILAMVVYNYTYARLLMVAGIDQRLPVKIGKLNQYRIPSNAIIFQTTVAVVITALVFFVAPYATHLTSPVNLSTEVYDVMLASSTLVWAFSACFLFVNLVKFAFNDRRAFRAHLIFPERVVWLAVILGSTSCFLAIISTLFYSWTSLIGNNQWLYIIGSLTFVCLVIAAVGSMLANSEASWESSKL